METLLMDRESELALPSRDREIGVNHLKWMCRQIYNNQVSGQTGAMWLGYVQGVVRGSGGVNLDEIKEMINRDK